MTTKNHALTNRRDFLCQSAVTVATGVAAWTLSAHPSLAVQQRARSNRGRIFKATKGGGIGETPAAMIERLQKLKALGFDGVEGGSPDIRDKQALRDAIRQTNFPVHGVVDGVHWQSRLSSPDRTEREKGRMALEQAVRDAYDIGGSSVLLVPGRVTGDDENHDHVWHRSIEEVRKVLPLASYFGVHILIETVWY